MKLTFFVGTPSGAAANPRLGHDPLLVTASAFLLLLSVVCADVKVGTRFSVLLFYLVPIAWTAWLAGRNPALVVALSSLLARLSVEWGEERFRGFTWPEQVWSLACELVFFLLFTGLLLQLQAHLDGERARTRRDALTSLLNAPAFEQAVAGEAERGRRYGHTASLARFDLDCFKALNDRLGYATGDEVLQTVARIVSGNIRQIDVAARLGDDQFALLLPQTNCQEADIVLQRLRLKIVAAMEGHEWPVTVSFGCVTFCEATSSVTAMLQSADDARIRAKKSGKNRICQTTYPLQQNL
jgi:diguanylate cyclase (GGDEF)-like protein